MGYSLAAKFASEAVGMCLTIFMGEGIIANELLPSTKGHALGYLGVAIGFGFAFGVNIAWFGFISAHLNPAMFFFLATLGKLEDGWTEFVVGACADFVGAFAGAVLVYLYFAPHFWTVPLPQDSDPLSVLIHGNPDALSPNAGRIASAFGKQSRPKKNATFSKEVRAFGAEIRGGRLGRLEVDGETKDGMNGAQSKEMAERERLIEKMEVRRKARVLADVSNFYTSSLDLNKPTPNLTRRRSFQVAGILHQHDAQLDRSEGSDCSRHSVQVAAMLHTHDPELGESTSAALTSEEKKSEKEMGDKPQVTFDKGAEEVLKFRDEAFEAAIAADKHAKLSIFATRPAIYNRAANFMHEMTNTCVLVFGAEMFNLRKEFDSSAAAEGPFTQSIFVSLFIMVLILGLGGTTSLAANPARDFGPRLAHFLLPIPGKGSSEWHYGWVPFFAPFVGAALGAAIFRGVEELYQSCAEEL